MLGAMTSLTGGGGLSASSSASNEQRSSNDISTGTISVGGLNLNPKPAFDSDTAIKLGGVALVLTGAFVAYKKLA